MAIPPTSYFSQFEKSPSPIKPTLVTEKTEEEVKDEETIPVTTTTEVVEKPSEENYFSQFETSEQSTEQSDYFSQFKTTPVKSETVKPKQSDYFSQFDTDVDPKTIPAPDLGQPTTAEKIAYGIDKQNMFFGNVARVIKAGVEAAFDPNREFKEVALANAKKEQADLFNRHEKFRGGKYDDDIEVLAAEMATFLVDPYYIFMYMTPWGRAMNMRQGGLKAAAKFAGFSAGTVSLDKLFDNLATTGEVNPKDVAQAGGIAGVLGPASMKAFQIIGKLLPKADKNKILQIVGVVEGRTAKSLGISDKEFKALQKIAGDREFSQLNKMVKATGQDWLAPLAKEQDKFYKQVTRIDNKINKIQTQIDATKGKGSKKIKQAFTNKIKVLTTDLNKRQKAFDKAQTALWKKQSAASKKVIDLAAKRDARFLEKLWQEKSLTEKTAQVVLSASTRPLMGAAAGYGLGKLWGGDDANLANWMMIGASLGATQKAIQASKILPGQSKNLIQRILYNDATKISFQKARELTSTTTSSKLAAIGGETEKIGLQLLEGIDSTFAAGSVSQRADNLMRSWARRTFNITKGYSLDDQAAALRIVRGSKEKVSPRINILANNIRKELEDFKRLREKAGIFSIDEASKTKTGIDRIINIKDYFPRVYNIDKIKENPEAFDKTIVQIFKSLGNTTKSAEAKAASFRNSLMGTDKSLVDNAVLLDIINGVKSSNKLLRTNPLSEHITKARVLEGPYAKVEKILEQKGYLVNDVNDVLTNLYNRSMKSIAFAEKFGHQGQMLKPYIQSISKKYKDLGRADWREKTQHEVKLITDTIDAFFDRYGKIQAGTSRSIAGTLATISNLNMLDRVTIASLGDLVQSFANSNNLTSFIQGALRTGFTAKRETGIAKNLNLNLGNEIKDALLKTGSKTKKLSNAKNVMGEEAVLKFDDGTHAANVMGKMDILRKTNEFGFKIMGLQWLTGLARRYTYNVGAIDAFKSSQKLAKYVSNNPGASLSSSKGLRLVQEINRYGLNVQQALKLGAFNNFDDALKVKAQRKVLNQAGILAANRDALIPQVQNRLLFAQSKNPWVRLMGQFTSWAMAKSTQTNKLLKRIEDGDVKQMVKLLASLPIYGGIQMLREIAKHGEVITEPAYNEDKWWAESLRLSGMSGILPELFVGRLTGPGSSQPWFIPFPAASVATDFGLLTQDALKGNTDKATRRFWDKIAPFPTYRKWIMDLFRTPEITREYKPGSSDVPQIKPQKFNTGGEVLPTNDDKYIVGDNLNKNLNYKTEKVIESDKNMEETLKKGVPVYNNKQEKEKMNIKDTAKAMVVAGALATGVNADVSKAQDNFLLPKEKPKVEVVQKEKPKDYSKLPELPENKKKFLLDSASVIYQKNKGRDVPSDILIAIAIEETGYGTGRFYEEGNTYFNMVAEKGDDSIKAKGDSTRVAKFDSPSESIDKFYTWVETKPHYKNVRETLEKYKQGEATKDDIIDAISDTGWAEDPNWSENVKSILKARVNGKHSEELKNIENSLFKK